MNTPMAASQGSLRQAAYSLLLGFAIFLLCLAGILTRPGGTDLASFWPANAVMLGLMIRFPVLANPLSWIVCALGFVLADLVTGASIPHTLFLNSGNMVAIVAGYLILSRCHPADRKLSRPTSVFYMLAAIATAAMLVGAIGMVADPILFGGSPLKAFLYWSVTDLVNYVAFLPMILTIPAGWNGRIFRYPLADVSFARLMPLLALLVTALAGAAIGGPGAVAFPVPALLWCALSYSLFTTSCLSFAFVAWTLLAISMGYLSVADHMNDRAMLLSIRVGVSLVGLAPLVVASVMAAREELMQRLLFLSNHDQMTGVLNRSAFLQAATIAFKPDRLQGRPAAVMMLDIDHFKSINDQYGHAAGDLVLIAFSDLLKRNVRDVDIVGRLGGEEFAVLLKNCTEADAQDIAARIISVFEGTSIRLADDRVVRATVSIGVAIAKSGLMIEQLLAHADEALYRAKADGRNRMMMDHGPAEMA